MGLKRGAIGNTLGKHIENLMGTHWELERNMLGTMNFFKKSLLLPPPQNLKGKKLMHF